MSISLSTVIPRSKKKLRTAEKYRNYILGVFLVTAIPLFLVGLGNWLIDPYDVFNTPDFWGLNHEKPNKDNNDRLFKAVDITRIKPIIIIMGSSRAKQGLNPKHPVFSDKQPAYNLAINGPNTYEVLRYIEHAIKNQPNLQEIVLGIDFFMFNENLANRPSFLEDRLEKKHIILSDAVNALFSLDTLAASQETVSASLKTPEMKADHGEDGFMPNLNANDGKTEWRFNESIKLYYELHSGYQFSERYFADFQKIVNLCQQNKIKLTVFISPSHATQWEAIRNTGQWETWEQWKGRMVKLIPVWDFSGYNSITTEKISRKMDNYVDNSHYSPKIGTLIFNKIFSYQSETIPQDFGVLLTPKNLDLHLAQLRRQRELWAESNADEVKLVKTLKQTVKSKKP